MTKSVRKSLNQKIILVMLGVLLALVIAAQCVYAPTFSFVPDGNSVAADEMNGVGITYTPASNGLVDNEYALSDSSVSGNGSSFAAPSADKQVDVIVSLDGASMLEYATQNKITVARALATVDGQKNLAKLEYIRETALNGVFKYIIEKRYDYTTVMNGFSATVKYGDIDAIKRNSYVKEVILSETYLAPEAVTENNVNVYETGIFNSEGVGYDGTGTVVAVVDTGTDYTHEVFDMELDPNKLAITKDMVASVASGLTATSLSADKGDYITEDNLYLSSKLPFAYDYADSDANVYPHNSHGTHVAGIIAGKSDVITGVATGAQIATFKVFSDYTNGAKTEWILAGLNDAVTLGVDAINMSLGTSCGFSREVDEQAINDVYDAINDAGICLVVAASNDASSAQNSTWGNTNLATNPDSGTLGSPGSYNASLSVASVSGVKTKYFMAEGKEVYFAESRLVGKTDPNDFVAGMLGDKKQSEFEYVVVPGIGLPANYIDVDVKGKIAVVKRGTNSFEEKVRVAAGQGAAGVIVYNNVSGTISMSVGSKFIIPSCFVTMDMSEQMVKKARGKIKLSKDYLAGPFMSDFSSWGALPNLVLAPDITGHGGDIYSAVAGTDLYDKYSGTSMASPNVAGATILVRESVKENHPEYTTPQIRDESYSRMMSTATIVKNEEGNPYSPRKQGSGIADIAHSINTKAYLTVDGLNKPKLSLGDDPDRKGEYTLNFNLVNTSGNAISYNLDQYVMTESMSSDDRTVAEKAYMFDDVKTAYSVSKIKGTYNVNGSTVSVSGYGSVAITVKITLTDVDKAYLNKYFTNGMYVEGFVLLESNNLDMIDLNIPFLAFYGDWTDAPMLDVTAYEVGASQEDTSILEEKKLKPDVYATLPYSGYYSATAEDHMGYYGMGAFAFIPASGYATPATQEKYAALTTNSDGDYMFYMVSAGLLRGAKRVDMEIRNSATGELIWNGIDYNARKSHASGEQVGGFVTIELDIRTLNLPNNSKYTFNMTCYLDWKGDNSYITDYEDQLDKMSEYKYGNKNTFSFEFTVDNEAPVLTRASVRKKEIGNNIYSYVLETNLFDNHYIQGYSVYTYAGKQTVNGYERLVGEKAIADGVIPVNKGEYNAETICSLDITGYWNTIMENDGKLYLTVYDYAKNMSSYEVVVTETGVIPEYSNGDVTVLPKEDVTISQKRNTATDYSIKINEQVDLSVNLNVLANINEGTDLKPNYQEGVWMKDLIWESDHPEIVDVTANGGVITGIKQGTAQITVRTPNVSVFDEKDKDHCLKFNVTVSSQTQTGGIALSGVDLSATSLAVERGELDENGDKIKISATIKPANYEGQYRLRWTTTNEKVVSIKVADDGMSVEITPIKSGKATVQANVLGSYISGYCTVTVLEEFNIYNNSYLRVYTGRGDPVDNVVEIPDDKSIVYIYPGAFQNNKYIKKVIVPDGVNTIMRAAFMGCESLEEVVLPESLETIELAAFADCDNLKKINLENVKSIGDSAFWNCSSLEEVKFKKCTYIDNYAFLNCSSLTTLDLGRVGVVGGGAFFGCTGLTEVTIPSNTSISYDTTYMELEDENRRADLGCAFGACENLETLIIESGNIGKHAFRFCYNLKTVVFKNDVNIIDDYAFASCFALENVIFEGSVHEIGNLAFAFCSALKSITLPDGLAILGSNVFVLCDNLTKINISSGALLDELGLSSLGAIRVSEFVVADGNKYLSSRDGVLYDRAQKKLIAYPAGKTATSFTVPATVKTIGNGAFSNTVGWVSNQPDDEGNEPLTSIAHAYLLNTINLSNVEYIESFAFYGMSVITATGGQGGVVFTGTSNIKYIGYQAFYNAFIGSSYPISMDKTTYIGDMAFAAAIYLGNASSYDLVIPTNLEYLGVGAFSGVVFKEGDYNYPISSVSFANSSIKQVGAAAFAGCSRLSSVNFGNLESLSDSMFEGCNALTSVIIPSTIKSLGEDVFKDCVNLANVKLDAGSINENGKRFGLTEIPAGAFYNTAITSFDLPVSVASIGDNAFRGTDISEFDLKNTTYIGKLAFADTSLTSIESANEKYAVTHIDNGAFINCKALTSARFPYAKTIGNNAFDGCEALNDVEFVAVDYVGKEAFKDCVAMGAVTLNNLTTLGARAFMGASGVTTVTLPKLQEIGAEAFAGTAITAIQLPATLSKLEEKAFYGADSLTAINVDGKNPTYKSMDGVLYSFNDKGMYTLVSYPAGKSVTAYSVYHHTIKLGAFAFNGNKHLEAITLPAYLQVIGVSAMNGMSALNTLTINATNAPTLESATKIVIPDKPVEDEPSGDIADDKYEDIFDENENKLRDDVEYVNFYDNFSFAYDDAGEEQTLDIYVPYNSMGYNNRVWKLYVGKQLHPTAYTHATLGTLELIDAIIAEAEKTTHSSADINKLVTSYGLLSKSQQAIVDGNYDYKENDVVIDKAYYTATLGGTDYHALLTGLCGKTAKASGNAKDFDFGITSDMNLGAVVPVCVLVVAAVIVVLATVLNAKRRSRK